MNLPEPIIEALAAAAYEASRGPESSRPPWAKTEHTWRVLACAEMRAALNILPRLGYRIEEAPK